MSHAELTFVCAFFEGKGNVPAASRGFYHPGWVDKLWRGIRRWYSRPFRLVCLSSHTTSGQYDEDVEVVDFLDDKHSWLNLMEFYRPDLELGRFIVVGLDTVFVGPLDDLAGYRGNYMVPADPYRRLKWCDGIICSNSDYAARIWDLWEHHRGKVGKMCGKESELVWLLDNLPDEPDLTDDLFPNQVVSYHLQVQHGPRTTQADGVRIVYFHGKSKPHNCKTDWVVKNWI